MAPQLSPVTPDVLRWAIDEDGRPVPELAEALKVDVDTVDGWTRGDVLPTRGQVSRLADVLRRPRALFFMPRPPTASTLPASFRHPPGDDAHLVSSQARRWIRQARRVQQAVSWAERRESSPDIPRFTFSSPPSVAAGAARAWLAVSNNDQAGWGDDYAALRAWRESIEDRGVLVFLLEIGPGEVRGFSAWDDHAPLIVANSSKVNPAARIFTLAHELGHLITRRDSACIEPVSEPWQVAPEHGDNGSIERWCEEFAASLLMPEGVARQFVAGAPATGVELVRLLARRFRVSHRAAALRLIDLQFAPRTLYAEVVQQFAPTSAASATSGDFRRPSRAVTRPREYGMRTVLTVLDALPPRDALSVLRMNVDDVRRLAERVPDVRIP